MKLQIKLDDDEKIVDVKFKTYGCGSAIASSTMFVDMLRVKQSKRQNKSKIKISQRHLNCHQSNYIVQFLQKILSRRQ